MTEDPLRVTIAEITRLMNTGEPVTFVDASNDMAWGALKVKLPGAIRVPVDLTDQHFATLPRDRRLIAYCT